MRILVIAIAVVVCSTATAPAQERQLGVKVGPTFGTLAIEPTDDEDGYRRRVGGGGGGFLVLPLATGLAIQIEGLYVQKGGKLEIAELPETATIILDYLEFPVMLRFGASRRAAGGVHVLGGAAAAVRMNALRQLSIATGRGRSGENEDIRHEIERLEASLVVGAGIDLHRHVGLDARYTWGLTPVNRDRTDGFEVRTRVLAIMVGIRF